MVVRAFNAEHIVCHRLSFIFFFLAEETGKAASRPGLTFLYTNSFSRDVG